MRKLQRLLFVFKQSYICYYIISMTVPLKFGSTLSLIIQIIKKKNERH